LCTAPQQSDVDAARSLLACAAPWQDRSHTQGGDSMRLSFIVLCLLLPATSWACGGFFCQNTPVDQVGEDIVFRVEGDDITAVVRIAFTGDEDEFAWVVPVPGVPDLAVGSELLFNSLATRTRLSFSTPIGDAECTGAEQDLWGDDDDSAFGDDDDFLADDDDAGPVEVLLDEPVGPYQAVVLSTMDAQALLDWLNCNDYRIANSSLPIVEGYIGSGMNFLALKMQGGQSDAPLVPISMAYMSPTPMIPLRLTAVATQPNLRVRAWFLANQRVVPTNFDHLWLNEARLPLAEYFWDTELVSPYERLVEHAANEMGGQAFATDFAGLKTGWTLSGYPSGGWNLNGLELETTPWGFFDLIDARNLPADGVMLALLRQYIPMPDEVAVSESSFYNNLDDYQDLLASQPFDPVAFKAAIVDLIAEPAEAASVLMADPAVPVATRMVSFLSGWEMSVDPTFAVLPGAFISIDQPDGVTFPHSGAVDPVREHPIDWIGGTAADDCSTITRAWRTEGVQPVQAHREAGNVPAAASLPDCQSLPAAAIAERFNPDGTSIVRFDGRADIAAAAPDGFCMPSSVPDLSAVPPTDSGWPLDDALMPVQKVDPKVCAELEKTGATDFDGLTGDDDDDSTPSDDDDSAPVNDDDATPTDDDDDSTPSDDDDSAGASDETSCASTGCGGGAAVLFVLPLGWARRRSGTSESVLR
jgi:hypothetical protein